MFINIRKNYISRLIILSISILLLMQQFVYTQVGGTSSMQTTNTQTFNRYQLTDVGLNQQIQVPVKISVLLVKGIFIPKISFLATFVFISVIITIAFSFWKPLIGAINGILSLIAIFAFLTIQFIKMRKELQLYDMIPVE